MPRIIRFGEFELDVDAYELRRAGVRIKLEKLPMELLTVLAGRAGTLVDRVEIHRAIWGEDVHVERDAAINTAMRKLRRVLHDDPEKPLYVETVIGKGYRFIATTQSRLSGRPSFSSCIFRRGRRQFVLQNGENLIGRDPGSMVFLEDPSVSRHHARVVIQSGRATLEDLKSRNGTFVDGRRITKAIELHHGAVVGIGAITLAFAILSDPASTQPISEQPLGDVHDAEA